jgi:hypothetical protein
MLTSKVLLTLLAIWFHTWSYSSTSRTVPHARLRIDSPDRSQLWGNAKGARKVNIFILIGTMPAVLADLAVAIDMRDRRAVA